MSCCCIPLQLALMLVLTFAPCAGGVFLPSTSANTPLAHVVVSTCCNLRWWCFSSNHWRKYSTCTRATCTVWWWLHVVVVYMCGGGMDLYNYICILCCHTANFRLRQYKGVQLTKGLQILADGLVMNEYASHIPANDLVAIKAYCYPSVPPAIKWG